MMGGGPEYPILGYYQIFYLWNLSPGRTKCCLLSRPKQFLHYIAYQSRLRTAMLLLSAQPLRTTMLRRLSSTQISHAQSWLRAVMPQPFSFPLRAAMLRAGSEQLCSCCCPPTQSSYTQSRLKAAMLLPFANPLRAAMLRADSEKTNLKSKYKGRQHIICFAYTDLLSLPLKV